MMLSSDANEATHLPPGCGDPEFGLTIPVTERGSGLGLMDATSKRRTAVEGVVCADTWTTIPAATAAPIMM
jgi:hypothetical protein